VSLVFFPLFSLASYLLVLGMRESVPLERTRARVWMEGMGGGGGDLMNRIKQLYLIRIYIELLYLRNSGY